ncbi:MAG: threonine--tRNA ligase [Deltaproteobacteria bacterium]|nr:threonine--tRNA ligase [Deltaproteobacteria bacterium]
MSTLISIELPDGSKRELPANATALDVATDISEGLARQVVVAKVNGEVTDLQAPLNDGDKVALLKADSPEGLDTLRHSAEHILATAVTSLFEGAQVTMGPKVHDGEFYYDFDIGRAFTPDDLEKINVEMKKLIKAKTAFSRETMSKETAREKFEALGQRYKDEILDGILVDEVSIFTSGSFIDLCRGPHVPHAGHIKAFQLNGASAAYWRGDSGRDSLQRIKGIAFGNKKELAAHNLLLEEAKKRDHRKIGKQLGLFLVSDSYDHHEYEPEADVEMLVTGAISGLALSSGKLRADSVLDDELLDGLRDVFAPRSVKMNGYNVTTHEEETRADIDIKIRLMSSQLNKEQREGLKALEKDVNERHPGGKIRVLHESHFTEEVGPGLPMWLPKGGRVRTIVEDQWRKMHFEDGYEIVYSPHIAKSDLWKVSGHWGFYRDSMFSPMAIDGQEYVAKPMNCPFHVLMFKSQTRSYRDLPLRWAELGTVYRYEMAGVLHGLMRVRGFTQDDAHIFCRQDQLADEVDKVLGFILKVLKTFGFEEFEVNLSTRPEQSVGEIHLWDQAENALEEAVKRRGLPYVVDEGGGAFYGPKIDVKLKDCIGRMWQCSTLQLDFNNPERFGLAYVNKEGKDEQPVMLHRALLGSIERFIGILIEQYAGAFPLWLAPEQVRILTVSDRFNDHADDVYAELKNAGFRSHFAPMSEKLGAKIRLAQLDKIPVMLIIGEKEVEQGGATIRLRDGSDLGFFKTADLIARLKKDAAVPNSEV